MIYLDNAATARPDPRAIAAAMPFLTEGGNPAAAHSLGRKAALAVIKAREQCAAAFGAEPNEIYFTSGGTESDNWAVFSALSSTGKRRIITTAIEHPAVLNACLEAERRGAEVIYLPPAENGLISPRQVEKALTPDTALVSVMAANNEVGTLQPVAEIGALCRQAGVLFHTDAVQAAGNIPLDMRELNVDMMSVSAHKVGGLCGCGLLYVRKGTPLSPLIFGGGQQRGMRSGTENTAGAVAFGAALENICADIPARQRKISALRDMLISGLSEIPRSRLNGSIDKRLCGNVNFSFEGIEGEALVLDLDLEGVCASSASACASGSGAPSHVLSAMGLEDKWLACPLRLSLSDGNTPEEMRAAVRIITECVERLRTLTGR